MSRSQANRGRPQQLPTHLSHKSSLVLPPPASITGPIETLRQKHDKQFHRWPPHINLIYPFLANASTSSAENDESSSKFLKSEIHQRIKRVLAHHKAFKIALSASPTGTFHHRKKSATVWLRPVSDNGDGTTSTPEALYDLQAALQNEFKECDADSRPFTPHLSIGQAPGRAPAENLAYEAQEVVGDFLKSENEQTPEIRESLKGLEWLVDRVCVIEREGFHDRFKVIGEIMFPTDSVETQENNQAQQEAESTTTRSS